MTLTAQYRPYRDEDNGLDGLDNDHLAWSDHEPGTIQIYEKTTEDLPFTSNRRLLLGVIMLSVLTLLAGFLIGYFSHTQHSECVPNLALSLHSVRDENPSIRAKILRNINSDSIKSVVREFSSEPHMAGSLNDLNLAVQIKDFLHAHNFDKVLMKNYTVLLSLADNEDLNYVELINESDNKTIYSSLNDNAKGGNTTNAYCAYSPTADLKGDIIFVNYGQLSDYQILQTAYNITRETIAGKILIAKQFHLTADEQMTYAHQMGASALLLYPDPEHYNPPQLNLKPFPDSPYMPSDAIRHDSLLWNGVGDPQTPGYPATPSAYRLPLKSTQLPSIPVQPISYATAYEILRRLGGREAPNKWKGGLNITYHLGPGFQNDLKLRLKINNKLVNKTIHNVIGYIRGKVEPDRYVIIGNHRDAWFKGAVDSSAGTAAFLELSRVFGDLIKEGWRPRRTLIFCSWGAEEFNLIGSTEWIEENLKILHGRAVAYINSDIIVIGNGSLSVAASPLLYHAIFNATKEVPNPNDEEDAKTVYEKWLISYPLMRNKTEMLLSGGKKRNTFEDTLYDYDNDLINVDKHFRSEESNEAGSILKSYMESAMQETRPKVRQLDMRSAYAPFFTLAGIPAVDITYTNVHDMRSEGNSLNFMSYPLLHTQYDDIRLIEKFIDSDYRYHKAVTQVLGEILRDLSDSLFIPFNLLDYAQVLKDFYITLHIHTESILFNNGVDIALLDSAIQNFTTAAIKFHSNQDKLDFTDPMAIRRVNDQLLLLERAFLDQNGLPRNVMKRHIVLSPSEINLPYDEMFPGLMDEFTLLLHQTDVKNTWSWDVIKAHFSILVFTIQSAADTIGDVV